MDESKVRRVICLFKMTENAAKAGSLPLISVARHPRIIAVTDCRNKPGQTHLHIYQEVEVEQKHWNFNGKVNGIKQKGQ